MNGARTSLTSEPGFLFVCFVCNMWARWASVMSSCKKKSVHCAYSYFLITILHFVLFFLCVRLNRTNSSDSFFKPNNQLFDSRCSHLATDRTVIVRSSSTRDQACSKLFLVYSWRCSNTDTISTKMVNSDIAGFYRDRSIFITGATGFMGKVLVEKLLRCCPGVKTLYLLMRPKAGNDIRTRLEELVSTKVFVFIIIFNCRISFCFSTNVNQFFTGVW